MSRKSEKKLLCDVEGLDSISIDEIYLKKFILSKSGPHGFKGMNEILNGNEEHEIGKLQQIKDFGKCYWAHCGLNPEVTKSFCEEIVESNHDVYVIMPYNPNATDPSAKKDKNENKEDVTYLFKKFKALKSGDEENIENELYPTGKKSSVAFVFKELYRLEEKVNFNRDIVPFYNVYNSFDCQGNQKEADKYHRNGCYEIKKGVQVEDVQKEFNKYDSLLLSDKNKEVEVLVGKLCSPYHVYLCDEELYKVKD